MPHILKNKNIEIHINLPLENYNLSRFDWTGKIVKVKFQNNDITGIEKDDCEGVFTCGKGLYNEFGIETPVGFNETKIGGWFHKIGIGLLKKEDNKYFFHKNYKIKPAEFKISTQSNKIIIHCTSKIINGYGYLLKKEIELFESSFIIRYFLQNTGEKAINTNEYTHNFLAINNDLIGRNYQLNFPFQLKPELFEETVNPEEKVEIGEKVIKFNESPSEQFFFSNLTGNENIDAAWELVNLKSNITISEITSFQTNKVNLWGWKHVISPELFFNISIQPKKSIEWSRTYHVYKIPKNQSTN